MSVRTLALATLALLPACTLLVKSDDLLGGDAPAGSDGGAKSDGGDGGLSGPCGVTFCDDFEGAGNIPWRTLTTGNATVTVDSARPHDGKHSMHANRPTAAGRDSAYQVFSSPTTLRSCEFDAYATSTTTTYASVFNLVFDKVSPPYTSYSIGLQAGGSISEYGERGAADASYNAKYLGAFAFDTWTHVRLEFDWDPSAPVVRYSVAGTNSTFAISPPPVSATEVSMGLTFQSGTGTGSEVFIDNVACAAD